MSGYNPLKIVNKVDTDCTNAMCLTNGECVELVIPTDGGVTICGIYCDTPIVSCDENTDDDAIDCSFAIATNAYGDTYLVGFDEDGNITSNEGGVAFEMEYFHNISTEEELDALIYDGYVDSSIYDALEALCIILA